MIQSLLLNRSLNLMLNKILGQRISIFTLHRPRGQHGLTGIDPAMLTALLIKLHNHKVEFIYLDDLVKNRKELDTNKHYVCFTIDDGYKDQVDKLLPVMLDYAAKPTMFVITNLIEERELPWDAIIASLVNETSKARIDLSTITHSSFGHLDLTNKRQARRALSDHVKRLGSEERHAFVKSLIALFSPDKAVNTERFRSSTWEELIELERKGLKVGSHTCSHQPLSTLQDEVLDKEIVDSKLLLERHLQKPSEILCYPVGKTEDFDERTINAAKNAGYIGGVTSEPGFFNPDLNGDAYFKIPRMSFPSSLGTAIRYSSWFEKLRAVK